MSTRGTCGLSLAEDKGELATGLVFPRQPAMWRGEEMLGRRGTRLAGQQRQS